MAAHYSQVRVVVGSTAMPHRASHADATLANLAANGEDIHFLSLNKCTKISDNGLMHLASSEGEGRGEIPLPKLTELSLEGCHKISDDGTAVCRCLERAHFNHPGLLTAINGRDNLLSLKVAFASRIARELSCVLHSLARA